MLFVGKVHNNWRTWAHLPNQLNEKKTDKSASKLGTSNYELLKQPTYLLDLASTDFHLFPNQKNVSISKSFGSKEKVVIAGVGRYFEELLEYHFMDGIHL